MKWMQRNIVTLVVAVALSVGFAGPAAVQSQNQNGLVNVAIGDVTIQDINVGIAAQIIANVCVNPVVTVQAAVVQVLSVVHGGPDVAVCTAGTSGTTPIIISQN
jgi:hypothetical protein